MISNDNDFNAASDVLSQGGVIAYPTEGVWGLGCDPFNEHAVIKLLNLKNRPVDKGLILVAASLEQVRFLIKDLKPEYLEKLECSWPGPVTWLIEDTNNLLPQWIKGNFSSVAIRVSAHPVVNQLCTAFGGCIVSTSLNTAGLAPALNEGQSRSYFGDNVDYYLSGELAVSNSPSSIIELASGKVIR